ncbi:MAG TPA: helix-turn-helix transcriptional regulator [Euzebya sp.]|nr:helix-turn-helix transcriptional regulator [Euzebya sp.]
MAERRSWQQMRADRVEGDPEFARDAERARLRFDLGQLVHDLRTAGGLTQAQLAARMRTTQSAIARLEGGGTNPTVEVLQRLGDALGVGLSLTVDDDVAARAVPLNSRTGSST